MVVGLNLVCSSIVFVPVMCLGIAFALHYLEIIEWFQEAVYVVDTIKAKHDINIST